MVYMILMGFQVSVVNTKYVVIHFLIVFYLIQYFAIMILTFQIIIYIYHQHHENGRKTIIAHAIPGADSQTTYAL